MTKKFDPKVLNNKNSDKYENLYSHLVTVHELQSLYFSGLLPEDQHKKLLHTIVNQIQTANKPLGLSENGIIEFAVSCHLPIDYIQPALFSNGEEETEMGEKNRLCIVQMLGSDMVRFQDELATFLKDTDKFYDKTTLSMNGTISAWLSVHSSIMKLKLTKDKGIQDVVLSIQKILGKYNDSTKKPKQKHINQLILHKESLKNKIIIFLPSIFKDDKSAFAFECGIKRRNFFDTVLMRSSVSDIVISLNDFVNEIKKFIDLTKNDDVSTQIQGYRDILRKYKDTDIISQDDMQKILNTDISLTDSLND
ncbi:hypothetical protein M9Y10_009534 [Tritrichomonas musculus]|uniref:Uncharacterized protein n=1 Tax=Tritrichomonas musculus TaxID=1915356 RepID=A0ABR2INL8_9EUKA